MLLAMITQRRFYGTLDLLLTAMNSVRLACAASLFPILHSSSSSILLKYSALLLTDCFLERSFDQEYTFGVKCPLFQDMVDHSFSDLFYGNSILIITNCKLLFSYMRNPLYNDYMNFIGLLKGDMNYNDYLIYVYHYFLTHIIFPVDKIQQQIDAQQALLFDKQQYYYLGLQIRIGDELAFSPNMSIDFSNNTVVSLVMKDVWKRSRQLKRKGIAYKWYL